MIVMSGVPQSITTTDVTLDSGKGIGNNKRMAETVGAGAALGTVIGAIAGGGKRAAIRVLVGAAGRRRCASAHEGTRSPGPRGNGPHVPVGQGCDATGRATTEQRPERCAAEDLPAR
jgi:hypothetical protein